MTQTRRDFLVTTTAAALGGLASPADAASPRSKPALRILILGGTGFIGPHQVRFALSRGHEVTLFNRGRTNTHLFPEVEKLRGDRNDDLESLKGREWDVVIDNSASVPRWVRQSAQLLKDAAEHYLFVSSISVYSDNSIVGMDETGPVGVIDDRDPERVTGQTYGPMKAMCEGEAEKAFPARTTVVRPGLIVGPGDNSDRFTYWPIRIHRGGEVMAPGHPTDPVQIVDARDLSEWMIRMLEEKNPGVYNATGPESPLSIAEMLYGIRAATSAKVSFTWVDADFLGEHRVRSWSHMPTWVPPREGMEGFSRVDCSRAIERGLTFRPLAVTARDTIDWHQTLPAERQENMRAGLSREREVEVLQAWHSRDR
jgi:2'-hydroxyisoflavone reductase